MIRTVDRLLGRPEGASGASDYLCHRPRGTRSALCDRLPQAQGGVGMGAFAAIRGGHREDGALVSQQPGVDGQHHLRRVRELLRRDVSQPIIQPRGEPTSKAVRHLSDSLFRRATGGAVFFCHPAPIGASDSHNLRLRAGGSPFAAAESETKGINYFPMEICFSGKLSYLCTCHGVHRTRPIPGTVCIVFALHRQEEGVELIP